ncbi:MAG: hypothetical protein F6K31_28325 [Symploca sp. SIO2G7]|nr:hypothetical protein [Symploca sp. SIO2G7]
MEPTELTKPTNPVMIAIDATTVKQLKQLIIELSSRGEIRSTGDGQFSVYDLIQNAAAKKSTREVWARLTENYSEVVTICDYLKFPGRGQRETPVTNLEGCIYIISLLPGDVGEKLRRLQAKITSQVVEQVAEPSTPQLPTSEVVRSEKEIDLELAKAQIELANAQIKLIEAKKAYQESSYWIRETVGTATLDYLRGDKPLALPPAPEPEKVFVEKDGSVVGSSKSRYSLTSLLRSAGYSELEARSRTLQKQAKEDLATIGINFTTGEGLEIAEYVRSHKVCPEDRRQDAIAALVQSKTTQGNIWQGGLDLD